MNDWTELMRTPAERRAPLAYERVNGTCGACHAEIRSTDGGETWRHVRPTGGTEVGTHRPHAAE